MEQKYTAAGINLEEWDAVAEMVFPPIVTIDDYYRPKVGKAYHVQVIIPDEERFLLSASLDHLVGAESGTVTGKRVELIVDGKALVDFAEWQRVRDEFQGGE